MMYQDEDSKFTSKRLLSEMRVFYGPSLKTMLSGFSIDISDGGLYLQTDFPLKVDEELILNFALPGQKKSITCNARVAWLNTKGKLRNSNLPPGAGIQFVNLSLDEIKAIRSFLQYNEVKPTW